MKLNLFEVPLFVSNINLDDIELESPQMHNKWFSNTHSSFNQGNKLTSHSYNILMTKICNMLMPILPAHSKINLQGIWRNKYIKDDFQENHIHAGSHFSFIVYVKGGSQTVFFAPHKFILESFYGEVGKDKFFPVSYESEFRPGQILIFPSFIEHMVKKSSGIETYAGNLTVTNIKEKEAVVDQVDKEKGYECN